MARFTAVEESIDRWAHRRLDGTPTHGARARWIEFLVFVLKQAWACVFGAALLAVIVAARLWYPEGAAVSQSDALVLAAVAIQVVMISTGLESGRELWVIVLFHVVGTVMEIFKTEMGSWLYGGDGIFHIGAVPLYTGFMYAAVGSYMVRVFRLFDLRFDRYPRRWLTAIVALLIYANFFTEHYIWDFRWVLLGLVALLYARTVMYFKVFRGTQRMPVLVAFTGVAFFIWIAENLATWAGAWLYPSQLDGWQMVPVTKLVSWFLLMMISVVLVAWVYPPQPRRGAGSPSRTTG